jgi:hypothetical protein
MPSMMIPACRVGTAPTGTLLNSRAKMTTIAGQVVFDFFIALISFPETQTAGRILPGTKKAKRLKA